MSDPVTLGATDLALAAIIATVIVAAVMAVLGVGFATQRARLPKATQLADLDERIAIAKAELKDKRDELSLVDQKITQRDHLTAEIAGLQARLEQHEVEWEGLADARQQIDQTRREAAEAAAEHAETKQWLDEIKSSYDLMRSEIEGGAEKMEAARQRLDRIQQEVDDLRSEATTLEQQMGPLRQERDLAARQIAEAKQWETRHSDLERMVAEKQGKLDRLEEVLAPLRDDVDRLRAEASAARQSKLETDDDLAGLAARVEQRRSEIERVEEELRQFEHRRQACVDEVAELEKKIAELEREASEREKRLTSGGDPDAAPDEATLLGDLLSQPLCLAQPAVLRDVPRDEHEALYDVAGYLKGHGLTYPDRTLRAFHTALKINDKAQITVLAGVSGTGKSLLPRRYAEAMGIHFLQIAVEPRWDSPQDMLGFYNYIERKFRATELARLLAHMDPHDTPELDRLTSGSGDALRRDHMALVLLDEMNLVRVEYYFSEFLSRLEARPPYGQDGDARSRAEAEIPIDIRGLGRELRLYPAHNLLFAGTMNDDESTQALSPKVLDRGNVLQFAAPSRFSDAKVVTPPAPNETAQSFKEWRSWVRGTGKLEGAPLTRANDFIGDLAQHMEQFGRPIGFRTRDAFLTYCANYPYSNPSQPDVLIPLSDQIEFRVLPRLRGLDVDSLQGPFDQLVALIRDELRDQELSDRLKDQIEEQQRSGGLFNWRGLTRS